jgi:uncharacterized protein (DUF1501 family)
MITSIAGAQLFTAGQTTLPMAISSATTGLDQVLNPRGYDGSPDSQAQLAALNALRSQDLSSELIRAASHVTDQAITLNSSLQSYQEISVQFPPTGIGNQLKQVARLIKKRTDLNVHRQIFFVQINGFDTHRQQVSTHNSLLSQTSQAMRCFYDEMVAQGLGDKVTQFTISDFGRTLNPAGTSTAVGSDHAWGNHHIVVGGVSTADFYGINGTNGTPFPTFTYDGPDDADTGIGARGRWIPTTSVEQYAATLARWFGLPDASLAAVFPNIGNFPISNLGFMEQLEREGEGRREKGEGRRRRRLDHRVSSFLPFSLSPLFLPFSLSPTLPFSLHFPASPTIASASSSISTGFGCAFGIRRKERVRCPRPRHRGESDRGMFAPCSGARARTFRISE